MNSDQRKARRLFYESVWRALVVEHVSQRHYENLTDPATRAQAVESLKGAVLMARDLAKCMTDVHDEHEPWSEKSG
jgi:hypothetical protein